MTEPSEVEDWIRVLYLGSGSFGVVSLWRNRMTDERIAVKRCKAEITEKLQQRWLKEIDLIENSRNENIVSFKRLPQNLSNVLAKHSKLPLLPMEYCSEGNLRHVLSDAENYFGLREATVRVVLGDLQNAIAYLHDMNIAHRDIKPENIVLQTHSERRDKIVYKLIDLGYAKEITNLGFSMVGTLPYLAPEILRCGKYDKSVDYWSFGIVVYEVICGEHPFLPHLPIPKRLEHLEKKKAEHIAMQINANASDVKYLSELPRVNKINACLKEDVEKWLRMCFHVDYKKRYHSLLPDLKKILRKQILTVFSVYTFEFYHYEYNDSTLISTLKDWIGRDTKIAVPDQLLLTATNCSNKFSDTDRIITYVKQDKDPTFYVYKKGEFTHSKQIDIPKTVKILLEENKKENWDRVKKIYAHSAHFAYTQTSFAKSLQLSCIYLSKYVTTLFFQQSANVRTLKAIIAKLLSTCECLNDIESKFKCKEVHLKYLLLDTLDKQRKVLNNSKQLVDHYRKCRRNYELFKNDFVVYQEYVRELKEPFDKTDLTDLYLGAISVAKKENGQNNLNCMDMRKTIHEILKQRHLLLKNEVLCGFFKKAWKIEKHYEILTKWYLFCNKAITTNLNQIRTIHVKKLDFLCKEIKYDSMIPISASLNNYESQLSGEELISENQRLLQSLDCKIRDILGDAPITDNLNE